MSKKLKNTRTGQVKAMEANVLQGLMALDPKIQGFTYGRTTVRKPKKR